MERLLCWFSGSSLGFFSLAIVNDVLQFFVLVLSIVTLILGLIGRENLKKYINSFKNR